MNAVNWSCISLSWSRSCACTRLFICVWYEAVAPVCCKSNLMVSQVCNGQSTSSAEILKSIFECPSFFCPIVYYLSFLYWIDFSPLNDYSKRILNEKPETNLTEWANCQFLSQGFLRVYRAAFTFLYNDAFARRGVSGSGEIINIIFNILGLFVIFCNSVFYTHQILKNNKSPSPRL